MVPSLIPGRVDLDVPPPMGACAADQTGDDAEYDFFAPANEKISHQAKGRLHHLLPAAEVPR
jgi:hypothetical protein